LSPDLEAAQQDVVNSPERFCPRHERDKAGTEGKGN